MALVASQSVFIQAAAAVTSQAITPTATPASGNIGIIISEQGGNGGGATSTGWSAVTGLSELTLPGSVGFLDVLYKVLGASEPSSYTVTLGQSNQSTLIYLEFSGRNNTTPFAVAPTSATVASGAHPLSIGATGLTANAGDDLLWICQMGDNGVVMTFTPPSGYGNSVNASGGTANQISGASCVNQNVSAGATGTVTGSQNWSGANTSAGVVLISIAQAAAVGPPPVPPYGPMPKQIYIMP